MRMPVFFVTVLLACVLAVAADNVTGDTDAVAAKAAQCAECHNAMVSLKGRGADAIASQTRTIRSGDKRHPPAGVEELSDEDVADIAAYLNALD